MDLLRLRHETADLHAATEETVPLTRPDLTHAVYADCLRGFYRVAAAWDAWSDAHVPAELRPLLEGRRRATLLADDLRVLGEPPPQVPLVDMSETVPGDPASVFLGRMYVMEGSTLGGQFIARHVEQTLGLNYGMGDSFFVGYGEDTSARWQQFRDVLLALPDSEADTVIASARQMFQIFSHGMKLPVSQVNTSVAQSEQDASHR